MANLHFETLRVLCQSFLMAILACGLVDAQAESSAPFHPCLSAGVKKSIVFIGGFDKPTSPKDPLRRVYSGTGFLINFDRVFYMVTAKHVIEGLREAGKTDNDILVFLNGTDEKLRIKSIAIAKQFSGADWIFGKTADIGLIPFPIDADFDIKMIPDKMFLDSTQLLELQDLFFISYQPGIEGVDKITPVTRRGMVSVVNPDNTFYMDAFAFPGNSGSPVFIKPSSTALVESGGIRLGDPLGCRFVGVLGEYLPYREVAISTQTKRPRVVFEENTGLARVWPVQAIREITASPVFQNQHNKLKEKSPPGRNIDAPK